MFRLLSLLRTALIAAIVATVGVADGGELVGRVLTPEGTPVAEAVVFVHRSAPNAPPPPTPGRAVMDQIGKEFVPHVLVVPAGTLVDFPNHDQIHHHVYSFSRAKTFEIPLYKGERVPPVLFAEAGIVSVGCNIHDWMLGYIVVVDTPFFATTGQDGRYGIAAVPQGETVVGVWHEQAASAVEDGFRTVTVGVAPTTMNFSLPLKEVRRLRPRRGLRSYE